MKERRNVSVCLVGFSTGLILFGKVRRPSHGIIIRMVLYDILAISTNHCQIITRFVINKLIIAVHSVTRHHRRFIYEKSRQFNVDKIGSRQANDHDSFMISHDNARSSQRDDFQRVPVKTSREPSRIRKEYREDKPENGRS